ncbi:response regulator transcription factor [Siphonobacter aquaeclarae]|uniref:Two component transcriptional regulator, LuxR family n=1 Tax=Siphonobacter aquaeclarae TaxID=563176 RepID=A0A1G9YMD8_9BACT|nr:response regulator transcription factor [Siphonobacter aquaeclarae]SDN10182.1 two component transcriptional regulator, LuxR family [Siphonobacter aquaeclarae]
MIDFSSFEQLPTKGIAVILDDHSLFAESFSVFLEKTGIFKSVFVFTDDSKANSFLLRLSGNMHVFVFLDYYLKEKTGLPLISEFKRIYKPLSLIIISSMTNPMLIEHVMIHPIDGFLGKSSEASEIIQCIKMICQQGRYVSPRIEEMRLERNQPGTIPFTDREIEILGYFAEGLSVIRTAEKMNLSSHTIVSHRRRMMAKAKVKSITELLWFARKLDLI